MTTRLLYALDDYGYWTGEIVTQDDPGIPPGFTDVAPPDVVPPEYATWQVAAWIVTPISPIAAATPAQWQVVTLKRDNLLYGCDWTQLPDVALTSDQVSAWKTYRTALRNITTQPDPFAIVWPAPPSALPPFPPM